MKEQILIFGLGHIGGSIAKSLCKQGIKVYAEDLSKKTITYAIKNKIIKLEKNKHNSWIWKKREELVHIQKELNYNHKFDISLINVILVARKAFEAYLINSAPLLDVVKNLAPLLIKGV